jgi:hypothetical protein
MSEFLVYLIRGGDGLGDFGTERVAESLAESLDSLLDQVLRVRRRMPQTTDERVERIPIGAAKAFQGVLGSGGTAYARCQYHAPVRGGDLGVSSVGAVGL